MYNWMSLLLYVHVFYTQYYFKEGPNDVKQKRQWKPTIAHKSPFKKQEINIINKPTAAAKKLYNWIVQDNTKKRWIDDVSL